METAGPLASLGLWIVRTSSGDLQRYVASLDEVLYRLAGHIPTIDLGATFPIDLERSLLPGWQSHIHDNVIVRNAQYLHDFIWNHEAALGVMADN